MTNTASVICICGKRMLRVRAQSSQKDIALGYYCPACSRYENPDRVPLLPNGIIKEGKIEVLARLRVPGEKERIVRLDREKFKKELREDWREAIRS